MAGILSPGSLWDSPQSPAHFLFPSRQVSLDPEIRDYAAVSFTPGRPVLDGGTQGIPFLVGDGQFLLEEFFLQPQVGVFRGEGPANRPLELLPL